MASQFTRPCFPAIWLKRSDEKSLAKKHVLFILSLLTIVHRFLIFLSSPLIAHLLPYGFELVNSSISHVDKIDYIRSQELLKNIFLPASWASEGTSRFNRYRDTCAVKRDTGLGGQVERKMNGTCPHENYTRATLLWQPSAGISMQGLFNKT